MLPVPPAAQPNPASFSGVEHCVCSGPVPQSPSLMSLMNSAACYVSVEIKNVNDLIFNKFTTSRVCKVFDN